MPVWSLIVWLVIGGAAGFLAQRIMGGRSPGGLLGDLVLGILGAIVGGYGLSLLGISGNGGLVATFIVALVGALALLWLVRQFKKGRVSDMTDKSWLESLSEILNKPLPGTAPSQPSPAGKPVVFGDDESLLDRITDILSKPLPGTEQADDASTAPTAVVEPENPGETAVREASDSDDDDEPVSTTAAAGADWMQREYERFNQHQEAGRQAFSAQQRVEQERFAAYQQAQLDQFMHSQERERAVFRHHQEARFQAWRHDLRHAYRAEPGRPPAPRPPGMRPPPPPPPWWRKS